ncbi:C-C motif chemokine 20 isoform X3 [Manacus candei]|uniref:C-C motif chemokine 20 isoform X3 n=1 Tax=Manacus candei TaxID=415023 RepID=UPI002227B5F4|nr:C-C motif chemokine 20 isoform X3 [Manacus candei]
MGSLLTILALLGVGSNFCLLCAEYLDSFSLLQGSRELPQLRAHLRKCRSQYISDCARQAVKSPWLGSFRDLARQSHDLIWPWQQFCPGRDVRPEGRCGYLPTKFSVMIKCIKNELEDL